MGSALMSGENTNFDEVELKNKLRNVLNPLWNSAMFFLMYAESNKWDLKRTVESENILDKWIIVRLNQVIRDISDNLSSYNIPPAVKSLEEFVDDLSRWYVRRSRDRISFGDNEALSTLYKVLVGFSKASAPLVPFISENIYKFMTSNVGLENEKSVHLCDFPNHDEVLIRNSEDILQNMKKTREVVSAALSIRVAKSIPVRQVLGSLAIKKEDDLPDEYKKLILDEVNIKEVKVVDSLDEKSSWEIDISGFVRLDISLTPDLIKEGRLREFIRSMQDLRKESKLSVSDEIILTYKKDDEIEDIVESFREDIKKKLLARDIIAGEENKIEKV